MLSSDNTTIVSDLPMTVTRTEEFHLDEKLLEPILYLPQSVLISSSAGVAPRMKNSGWQRFFLLRLHSAWGCFGQES